MQIRNFFIAQAASLRMDSIYDVHGLSSQVLAFPQFPTAAQTLALVYQVQYSAVELGRSHELILQARVPWMPDPVRLGSGNVEAHTEYETVGDGALEWFHLAIDVSFDHAGLFEFQVTDSSGRVLSSTALLVRELAS
jgi:hypothetical protein